MPLGQAYVAVLCMSETAACKDGSRAVKPAMALTISLVQEVVLPVHSLHDCGYSRSGHLWIILSLRFHEKHYCIPVLHRIWLVAESASPHRQRSQPGLGEEQQRLLSKSSLGRMKSHEVLGKWSQAEATAQQQRGQQILLGLIIHAGEDSMLLKMSATSLSANAQMVPLASTP